MATPIAFESVHTKEAKREEKRKAREDYLEKVKRQYEKEEYKKEQAKLRGENTWMLPSLSDKIDKEQKEIEKIKSKKHKKEKKKKKKHKKEKKKKNNTESDSSDDSDEDDGGWVEKTSTKSQNEDLSSTNMVKGPRLERDSWMVDAFESLPMTSRKEIRDKEKQEKEKTKDTNFLDQPGMHERELNPYWKDGGMGLPEEDTKKEKKETNAVQSLSGDGGLSWMKKCYQRCVQQAEEEGRSLEDIAAERYGSLKKLKSMLAEAEEANRKIKQSNRSNDRPRYSDRGSEQRYSGRSRDHHTDNSSGNRRTFMKPGDNEDSDDHAKSHTRTNSNSDTSSSRSGDKYRRSRSRSRDRSRPSKESHKYSRSRSRSRSRERSKRNRSRDRYRYSRSRSRDRSNRESYRHRSRSRSRERLSKRGSESNTKLSSRFMKPGDDSNAVDVSSSLSSKYKRDTKEYVPTWKKKEYIKPKEEEMNKDKSVSEERKRDAENRKELSREKRRHSSSSSSSSPSSSSSDSESENVETKQVDSQPVKVEEVKILSDKEMNEIGAKILRAEMMGDDDLAVKLKSQLEASQKAKAENKGKLAVAEQQKNNKNDGDNVAVLTRTDRSGMVRPLPQTQHGGNDKQHGRKKKQKVATHAKSGERERYFDDDDKYSLKNLVEREKMGTAEDQNRMFARLAGRAFEKGDDDFQVDDIFMSRASKKQSEAQAEEKDRSMAIYEHKKMAKALETCTFCFENVPKHLIIAIGMKVYLCLPNHRSLTEGHCLIVPMQHVASGTAVDEDVWNEIQVFRKGLTKMFQDRDEDVVFMETSMKLKYFPHMHIECVPMPKETGDLAPIYFKKAIQESESEWSDNKKLVDLSQKDIRRSVPKGFPYFSVDFGLQGGFAHVIEDEQKFPSYFGREIVGGMVDAEPGLWRKPKKENFDDQRKKVLQFAEWWKPYDWTNRLEGT